MNDDAMRLGAAGNAPLASTVFGTSRDAPLGRCATLTDRRATTMHRTDAG